jgi:cbb3-type cytochrome oxidase subunit 3
MINRDKCFKLIVYLAISLAFFVSVNNVYAADSAAQNAYNNLGKAAINAYGELPSATLPETIGNIVGVGLSFIGVLFLGLMIYGGFYWMLARGNQAEVTKAKELIEAAVIGLIIVMAAYAITAYVGNILLPS